MNVERLNLAQLKAKTPADLLAMAEEWEIENAPSMRKGEMMFSILKEHAEEGWEIGGDGVLEVLQDGFGFLRSPSANYLPGPDDIYVGPEILRQFSLRTGDTNEGLMQVLADEMDGICPGRANSINPGATRTGMRAQAYPGENPANNPLPEAIMPLYLYLMGPDSVGVNGQAFDAQ